MATTNARRRQRLTEQRAREGRVKRNWNHRRQRDPTPPKTKQQLRARWQQNQAELAGLRAQLATEKAARETAQTAQTAEQTAHQETKQELADTEKQRKDTQEGAEGLYKDFETMRRRYEFLKDRCASKKGMPMTDEALDEMIEKRQRGNPTRAS